MPSRPPPFSARRWDGAGPGCSWWRRWWRYRASTSPIISRARSRPARCSARFGASRSAGSGLNTFLYCNAYAPAAQQDLPHHDRDRTDRPTAPPFRGGASLQRRRQRGAAGGADPRGPRRLPQSLGTGAGKRRQRRCHRAADAPCRCRVGWPCPHHRSAAQLRPDRRHAGWHRCRARRCDRHHGRRSAERPHRHSAHGEAAAGRRSRLGGGLAPGPSGRFNPQDPLAARQPPDRPHLPGGARSLGGVFLHAFPQPARPFLRAHRSHLRRSRRARARLSRLHQDFSRPRHRHPAAADDQRAADADGGAVPHHRRAERNDGAHLLRIKPDPFLRGARRRQRPQGHGLETGRLTPAMARRDVIALAALAIALIGVRAWLTRAAGVELHYDEAQYWEWSQQLDWSYYSKGPLVAWLIALSETLFGHGVWQVRLPAWIAHGALLAVVFRFALDV